MTLISDDLSVRAIVRLCHDAGTPFAKRILSSLKNRDAFKSLFGEDFPISEYANAPQFSIDFGLFCSLKKFKGVDVGIRKSCVALRSWKRSESICRESNERLSNPLCWPPLIGGLTPQQIITSAQVKIEKVLGLSPNYRRIISHCRFSKGSTVDHPRGTPPAQKLSDPITVTRGAYTRLKNLIESDLHWLGAIVGHDVVGPCCLLRTAFKIVDSNKWLTVSKTWKTDRSIASEPTGNAFLQQGVGRFIRERLKRFGVDLDDQSRNQKLAALAYSSGLATLDLSAASDSVCRALIDLLLPEEWKYLLYELRSPFTKVRWVKVYLEKFSSMGNAFTFELESLIFWAITESVVDLMQPDVKDIGIYGDDIICASACAKTLSDSLGFFGFELNSEKSYFTGPYYESCGKHYFQGTDVTPFYQKEEVCNEFEVVRLTNRIVRWLIRSGEDPWTGTFSDVVNWLSLHSDTAIPYQDEADDRGILTPYWEMIDVYDRNHGFSCLTLNWVEEEELPGYGRGILAYKLRKPQYSLSSSDGRRISSKKGRHRKMQRYIQLANPA